MRQRWRTLVGLAVIFAPQAAVSQPFVTPLGGIPYQDWTIVNYVDLAAGGIRDYRGGEYTYDGHNAIDFTLPHFAAMDAGITVNAAAAGTVIAAHDDEFDRCSRVNPCGNQPNYILIDHGNGIATEYLHLKKDSIQVNIGQTVTAGQTIAEVGSSGLSSDAHLHFAVYENGQAIETYLDPQRWWIDPVPYAGDVSGSLDHGVVQRFPTTEELVERPVDANLFQQSLGSGQSAVVWAHLHGIDAGDDLDYHFYQPDGLETAHLHWDLPSFSYGWWYAAINLPAVPELGIWSVDVRLNGTTLFSESFEVVDTDLNGDGSVDAADAGVMFGNWGAAGAGDANRDGIVDAADAGILFSTWTGDARPIGVPEPASCAFASAIGLVLFGRLVARRSFTVVEVNRSVAKNGDPSHH